jgi:hypothetical protein
LIIEAGRAAISCCATLLAKVGEKYITAVDSTVANISVPGVDGGYR